MISRENYKSVRIHILTYKKKLYPINKQHNNMSEELKHTKIAPTNKVACPVCSNFNKVARNAEESKKIHKLFSKTCELCLQTPKMLNNHQDKVKYCANEIISDSKACKKCCRARQRSIGMQTNQTDLNKNLNLLNEVLTVFQNNKEISKTVSQKDAYISTDAIQAPNLRISKVFQFSTDDPIICVNDRSTIITSHEDIVRNRCSLDLSKHKSSSVPQMKLDELKSSVKEKARSKDAVEEVNRMFANVTRKRQDDEDKDLNRPSVRNGPRILPVIKKEERASYSIDHILSPCRFCRSDDFSSGDSFLRTSEHSENCNQKENSDKTDNCVYMCGRYKCCRRKQKGFMHCKCCGDEANFRGNRGRSYNPDNDA